MSATGPVITNITYNNQSIPLVQGLIPDSTAQPDFSYGGYNRPQISGTATPGSTVYIIYNDWVPLGSVVAKSDWTWDFQVPEQLSSGVYAFSAAQSPNPPGSDTPYAELSNLTSIVLQSQREPVITSSTDNTSGSIVNVDDRGQTSDTTPTIVGTAEPGSRVYIYDNNVKIGEILTKSTGASPWDWSFTPSQPLDSSTTHTFTVASSSLSTEAFLDSLQTPYQLVTTAGR